MATWDEMKNADPDMAGFGIGRIKKWGVPLAFLATVRKDGGPRIHPVCPIFASGRLFVSIGAESPKQWDLRRNPRYMLHSFPDEGDPEFSVRGDAVEVTDPEAKKMVIDAIEFAAYNPDDPIFELNIDRADSTIWENWKQPDTRPVRRRWIATA
jgi:hypothetical protein